MLAVVPCGNGAPADQPSTTSPFFKARVMPRWLATLARRAYFRSRENRLLAWLWGRLVRPGGILHSFWLTSVRPRLDPPLAGGPPQRGLAPSPSGSLDACWLDPGAWLSEGQIERLRAIAQPPRPPDEAV